MNPELEQLFRREAIAFRNAPGDLRHRAPAAEFGSRWLVGAFMFVIIAVAGTTYLLASIKVAHTVRGHAELRGAPDRLRIQARFESRIAPRPGDLVVLVDVVTSPGCPGGWVVGTRPAGETGPVIVEAILDPGCAHAIETLRSGFAIEWHLPERSLLSALWPG